MLFPTMDGIQFGVSGRRKKNGGPPPTPPASLSGEADEWTGERQGKGEKVPHEVRTLHTWTDAGSTETRNVDPDETQA